MKEKTSPVPAARLTGEDLTQRRKGAKDAEEEKRVFVRKYSVKFHAYRAYNAPSSSLLLFPFASSASFAPLRDK
jgi:hypothetical protein